MLECVSSCQMGMSVCLQVCVCVRIFVCDIGKKVVLSVCVYVLCVCLCVYTGVYDRFIWY